jgi:hypothetical protein
LWEKTRIIISHPLFVLGTRVAPRCNGLSVPRLRSTQTTTTSARIPIYHIRFGEKDYSRRTKKPPNKADSFYFDFFAASCRSRNSRFAPRRVRAPYLYLVVSVCAQTNLFNSFCILHFAIDPPVVLCGPQLASMLGCWAATKDVKSIGACREHAQTLFECMRTAVRHLPRFFSSFRGRELTKSCVRVQQTAYEAQTTQTVNQLPFGAIGEDTKGLTPFVRLGQ